METLSNSSNHLRIADEIFSTVLNLLSGTAVVSCETYNGALKCTIQGCSNGSTLTINYQKQDDKMKVPDTLYSPSPPVRKEVKVIKCSKTNIAFVTKVSDDIMSRIPSQPGNFSHFDKHLEEQKNCLQNENTISSVIPALVNRGHSCGEKSSWKPVPKYFCHRCGMSFIHEYRKNYHESTNVCLRAYTCRICHRIFESKSKRASHETTHVRFYPKSLMEKNMPVNKSNAFPSVLYAITGLRRTEDNKINCREIVASVLKDSKEILSNVNGTKLEKLNKSKRIYILGPLTKTQLESSFIREQSLSNLINQGMLVRSSPSSLNSGNDLYNPISEETVIDIKKEPVSPEALFLADDVKNSVYNAIQKSVDETHSSISSAKHNLTVHSKEDTDTLRLVPKNGFRNSSTSRQCSYSLRRKPSTTQITHEKKVTSCKNVRKRYKCSFCNKKFAIKGNKAVHERMHTGEKPFDCLYCDKTFTHISSKVVHERTHTGEKPYQCGYCDKSFSRTGTKVLHERIHTGEKPYNCKYCDQKFLRSTDKAIHERKHTGEKPYRCQYCCKSFFSCSDKNAHEKRHTNGKLFRVSKYSL